MSFRRCIYFSFAMLTIALPIMTSGSAEAGVLEKLFAPKAKLWDYWVRHDNDSDGTIDHSAWASFLSTYVNRSPDGINRVDYGDVTDADRDSLNAYIDSMQSLTISGYSRPEQFAYWVNLYNAVTVDIILDHYPVNSIRDIKLSKGLLSKGPWSKKLLDIEGKELSLNDIEHRILRPIWRDPRIHYAVNCASIGCPNLMAEPYTAENTERLLDRGAEDYVNHSRGVRIDNGRLDVSSIYAWFESDFGGSDAGVIDHIKRYAEPALAKSLHGINGISGDDYDWSLNDVGNL